VYSLGDIKVLRKKSKADMELLKKNGRKYQFSFSTTKDRDEFIDMLESLWVSGSTVSLVFFFLDNTNSQDCTEQPPLLL
jgi:hypothetical protein